MSPSDEYRLLIAAASAQPSGPELGPDIDWSEVLSLARHHRLEALLHRHVGRHRLAVPDTVAERLRSAREQTMVGEMGARRQLQEVGAVLSGAGIRAVAIKGGALLHGVYPDKGLRPMADLDLLVGGERLDAAMAVLQRAGYDTHRSQRAPRGPDHHADPLRRPDRWLPLELHSKPGSSIPAGSGQALAARATADSTGSYLLPTPADHLLVLAGHFVDDRTASTKVALGQLADIAHVIAYGGLDWAELVATANSWGVRVSAHPALYAVSALGLATVPADALEALSSSPRSLATARELLRDRVLGTERDLTVVAKVPRGVHQWLFPGVDYMRRRYRRPHASVPELYWRRAVVGVGLLGSMLRRPRQALAQVRFERRLRGPR